MFDNCLAFYYGLFYGLEDNGALDIEEDIHLEALHYVFTPRINQSLSSFQAAWNTHGMSTASHHSPLQLWSAGMVSQDNHHYSAVQEVFAQENAAFVQPAPETLSSHHQLTVNPLTASTVWGVDIYAEVLETLLNM